MAPPNLTRVDAERRAALLDVTGYTVELDLTDGSGAPGESTFATTATVQFACREPGADSWIDFVGAEVSSATLNGTALDVSGYREDDGIALPGLAAENELVVVATGRYMNTGEGLHRFVDPVDGAVYLYSQFETADAKRLFACFDQPDLKARYTLTVTAPADWKVVSNATAQVEQAGTAAVHRFATSEIMSTYLVALVAGPYAEWRDEHVDDDGHDPPRHLLPCLARRAHGRRAAVHRDQAGLRLLPPQLRHPVPVRQVRPAVRPGVQRGRDGERRRGDVPRGLRLPQPRHPLDLRAPRRDRAARDGAHVVRRPRDHALVGRPVAQRVVRDVRERALPGAGHRVHRGVDDLRERREELGVPPGPAPLHPPGRRRHPGPAGRRGQLRRDHLRQGRVGAQAARRLRRARAVPRRAARLLRGPQVGQRDLRRPAGRAGAGLGARPVGLGRAVAQDHRAQPAAALVRRSTTTARSPASTSSRAAPGPVRASCARTGSPSGSTTTTARASSCAPTASRSTSRASAPPSRS